MACKPPFQISHLRLGISNDLKPRLNSPLKTSTNHIEPVPSRIAHFSYSICPNRFLFSHLSESRCLADSLKSPRFSSLKFDLDHKYFPSHKTRMRMRASSSGGDDASDIDEALSLDSNIPPTPDMFIKKVSSKAYYMRRNLEQTIESNSYDVLEANPWREADKPVYVLAKEEGKIFTMRTRRPRREVELELNLLFSHKRANQQAKRQINSAKHDPKGLSNNSINSNQIFRMHVEDIRDGVLVFEDEEVATNYCSILEKQGDRCVGIAQVEANDIFNMCQKSNLLAILFRRDITPPQPDQLKMNLKARKRSLDEEN